MSETLPEGVTREEFAELKTTVTDFIRAQEDLARARTDQEREDAHEEVAEATADLDALAKELGISPKNLRTAADKARRDERKEELRPLLQELLAEELADDETAEDETEQGATEEGATEEESESEDSAPTETHWSSKSITDVIRGR